MEGFYNKHYIRVDESGRILHDFSDAFKQPSVDDICINEKGGYQFRLFPDGEENPLLFEQEYMIPLYKWNGQAILPRTTEEIAAEIAAIPAAESVPTQLERIEAQITYTAMMTDTLLEA